MPFCRISESSANNCEKAGILLYLLVFTRICDFRETRDGRTNQECASNTSQRETAFKNAPKWHISKFKSEFRPIYAREK